MYKRALFYLVVLAVPGIFLVYLNTRSESNFSTRFSSGVVEPIEVQKELYRQLTQAKPGSRKAQELQAAIEKVRLKASRRFQPAENPSAFLEALADLKTTRDGRRYEKNYKQAELSKARRSADEFSAQNSLFRRSATDPIAWRERGPGNVSGRVQSVIVDISDASGNTWFAATIGGGVWKTSDAGQTWQHKSPEMTIYSTSSIVQSQSNPDVFYVGTGMGYGRVVELVGNGVWKSEDHGESWTQLASTANGELLEAINRIVVDPNDDNVVLVCSNDSFAHLYAKGGTRKSGIFRTTNGGQTWTQVYDPDIVFGTGTDNRVQQIVANPKNFNTQYAAVNEIGVIKSTDAGLTWQTSANNFALASDIGNPTGGGFGLAGISVRTELAISPTDTSRVYAAVERPRGVGDLYMSRDAGASWSLVNDTGNDPNWFNAFGSSGATGAYTAGWFDNTIAVHPFDENVVFVGGVNMFRFDINLGNNTRSSTQISNWLINLGLPTVHADQHDLKMIPISEQAGTFRILNANDGGVAISNDGGANWTQITGMNSTQFYGVDKKPGEDVYIGGMQDNNTFHSGLNPGPSSLWTRDFGGDGFEAVWHYADPNLVLGSSQFGTYRRSTDGANTWTTIPQATVQFAPFFSKIASTKSDPDLVFTFGSQGVNRSDDFGESWVLTPITGNWIGYRPFDNIEISIADPQVVWISSRLDVDPPAGIRGGNHISRDGGLSFNEISQNFPPNVTESSGIGTHPTDPETAYYLFSAPGQPKILRTANFGLSFEDLSGFGGGSGSSNNGFPDVATFALLVMPFDTNVLWVGTEIGLFISEDNGVSWRFADNGFPTVSIMDMKIVDGQIVVATYGRGIWTVDLPELSDYRPLEVTQTPRLRPIVQDFSLGGSVSLAFDLRSAYDSTHVFVNNQMLTKLDANVEPTQTVLDYLPEGASTLSASLTAYKDGRTFESATRTSNVISIAEAVPSIEANFDNNQLANFIASGFSVTQPAGFSNNAIHSLHPYPNNAEVTFTITQPFTLVTGEISFDEIVLVEPGLPNVTDYRDPNFFDFCVVEGSLDGINWTSLAPGYDSRDASSWLTTYNSGGSGTPALFRNRNIVIPENLFSPRDEIFVRFRLAADPAVNGWGWSIDNLVIQRGVTSVGSEDELPHTFALSQNYPNPFNPTTTISYQLAASSDVLLKIFNLRGQQVRILHEGPQLAGPHEIQWNGRDDFGSAVASGMYVYRLRAGDFVASRKMLLAR